ncbi:MAG: hypothetical protein JO306_11265 [Gemmatimonadetes bacterium]|nr:hypothetical protein [Gemmatimonadota bacterium]
MGLDAVELVMAWEETFGIAIPDEVAARFRTPREVTDWLAGRLGARRAGPCGTRRAFLRVRDAIAAETGVGRRQIRPRVPLGALFTADEAGRRAWSAVGRRVGDGWPRWPGGGEARTFWDRLETRWKPLLRLQSPLAEAVRPVAACAHGHPPAPGEAWTREQVALMVRRVTMDEIGIDAFGDDHEFVRDMGID